MAIVRVQTDLINGRIGGSSSMKEMKLTDVWGGWKGTTKCGGVFAEWSRRLPTFGRQPGDDIARISVRGKSGIKDVLDFPVLNHKSQAFQQRHTAGLEG